MYSYSHITFITYRLSRRILNIATLQILDKKNKFSIISDHQVPVLPMQSPHQPQLQQPMPVRPQAMPLQQSMFNSFNQLIPILIHTYKLTLQV